ncbi:hypothetical protein [Bosea sp. BH3]|uniref:hypothetical protein n=1 Tax=Bosea sp. BH3 TaxID=2871701 RepID=UPI0021CB1883|nr:hypothetical protein [Bosea sp. BH3]MCU4180789.1 hypothetical protein [Bosea sp. BH3]
MRRIAAAACLFAAAALLPAQAEARPRGGRSDSAATTKTSSTLVVIPGAAGAGRVQAGETGKPERVPFPPFTMAREEPPQLRLTTANEGTQKPWCRSDMVVGGFCLMN